MLRLLPPPLSGPIDSRSRAGRSYASWVPSEPSHSRHAAPAQRTPRLLDLCLQSTTCRTRLGKTSYIRPAIPGGSSKVSTGTFCRSTGSILVRDDLFHGERRRGASPSYCQTTVTSSATWHTRRRFAPQNVRTVTGVLTVRRSSTGRTINTCTTQGLAR
jgi:hypothetical protein